MILDEVVDKVHDYKEFLTVKELNDSAVRLAEERARVKALRAGSYHKPEQGRVAP